MYCGHGPYTDLSMNRTTSKDCGPRPFVTCLTREADQNCNFRTTLWTGEHLQVTLMCLKAGEDIGLEVHPATDQMLRVEEGCGIARLGGGKENPECTVKIRCGDAIMVPAGTWHNIVNTGNCPLKLSSVYAPPAHPRGTVHRTKAEARAGEGKEAGKDTSADEGK